MSAKPETLLVQRIIKALRHEGAFVLKVHGGPYQVAGVPDLLCCVRGRLIGLEVKVGSNNATPLQEKTMADIRAAGGIAAVVRSVEEALEVCSV